MFAPPSRLFHPLPLDEVYNCDRAALDERLRLRKDEAFGSRAFRGIPFVLGRQAAPNAILLDGNRICIPAGDRLASYLVFAHIVEDRALELPADLADFRGRQHAAGARHGNDLGDLVAEYQLHYADGNSESVPIRRRFAIQQAHIEWGASAFAAVPHQADSTIGTIAESLKLGRMPAAGYGQGETRHNAGRDSYSEHIWLYALPNPQPGKPIREIRCIAKEERALIFGISATQVSAHPLRSRARQKLAFRLPVGVAFNALGELDDVDIDLGNVISARALQTYDRAAWFGDATNVQPQSASDRVFIEFAAHPEAKLYLRAANGDLLEHDLAKLEREGRIETLASRRLLRINVVDSQGREVAARIHFHGESGEYLPPRGNHRRVNRNWFEDNYGEFVNGANQYAYILGSCELDAPLGEVFVEITRGY